MAAREWARRRPACSLRPARTHRDAHAEAHWLFAVVVEKGHPVTSLVVAQVGARFCERLLSNGLLPSEDAE